MMLFVMLAVTLAKAQAEELRDLDYTCRPINMSLVTHCQNYVGEYMIPIVKEQENSTLSNTSGESYEEYLDARALRVKEAMLCPYFNMEFVCNALFVRCYDDLTQPKNVSISGMCVSNCEAGVHWNGQECDIFRSMFASWCTDGSVFSLDDTAACFTTPPPPEDADSDTWKYILAGCLGLVALIVGASFARQYHKNREADSEGENATFDFELENQPKPKAATEEYQNLDDPDNTTGDKKGFRTAQQARVEKIEAQRESEVQTRASTQVNVTVSPDTELDEFDGTDG